MGLERRRVRLGGVADTLVRGAGHRWSVMPVVRPLDEPMTRTDETHRGLGMRRLVGGVRQPVPAPGRPERTAGGRASPPREVGARLG